MSLRYGNLWKEYNLSNALDIKDHWYELSECN